MKAASIGLYIIIASFLLMASYFVFHTSAAMITFGGIGIVLGFLIIILSNKFNLDGK